MPKSLIFIVLALAGLGFGAMAQEQDGPNIDPTATGEPGGVAQYDMAQRLYRLAVAHKDALMAMTAARLAAGVQMTDVERERGSGNEAYVSQDSPPEGAEMLATARAFSVEDEILESMIEDIEAEIGSERNRIGGASRQLNHLAGGTTEQWKIPFFGSSYAEIGVVGDGNAPLSVAVTDENDNPVACPVRVHDIFYCNFVPRWNGYFKVTVTNQGEEGNGYYLLTN